MHCVGFAWLAWLAVGLALDECEARRPWAAGSRRWGGGSAIRIEVEARSTLRQLSGVRIDGPGDVQDVPQLELAEDEMRTEGSAVTKESAEVGADLFDFEADAEPWSS